jgi:hypothetical protein
MSIYSEFIGWQSPLVILVHRYAHVLAGTDLSISEQASLYSGARERPNQQRVLTNEQIATQIAGQREIDSVVLVKALGGGWTGVKHP